MDVTTHSEPSRNGKKTAPIDASVPHTVDELLALDVPRLEALYQSATVPKIDQIEGDLKGRMLAWPSLSGVPAQLLRSFASSDRFPWRGKSFHAVSADSGEGINRVVSDRWKVFKFTTFVGPSRAGAFDAVQLDYDHASNPFFIRAIKDEIRELRPGLYLGQAWLQTGDKTTLVLYFGLQSR